MAQVPRVGPGNTQLRTESVIPKESSQAEQNFVDSLGQGLQTIGGAVEKVASEQYKQLYEARKFTDTTQAKIYATQAMADSMIRHENETTTGPDGKVRLKTGSAEDFASFDNDVKTIRENSRQFFHSKEDEQEFMGALDLETITARNKLQNVFLKNQINQGQAVILEESKNLSDKYALTGDKAFLDKQKELWNTATAKGFFDADTAYTKNEAAVNKAQEGLFINDAKGDRELAKKRIEEGYYGFDAKETDTALSALVHYKDLEDKNTLINKIDNRYNLVDAIATGKENIYDLSPVAQNMVDNDDVLSEAVSKAKQSKQAYLPETANEELANVFQEASNATNRDALSSLATSLIYRDKNINPDKLGLALFYASKKASNLNLSEKILTPIGTETTEDQILATQMDAGLNSITRWARSGAVSKDEHGQVIVDFMSRVKNGEKPFDALNTTIKNANIKLHPEMVNYPKEGTLIQDAQGRQAVAYPDGTIKRVEAYKPNTSQKSQDKKGMTSFNAL